MNAVFYISGAVAILATAMAISRTSAIHALLYLVLSLLAVAIVFYTLGAAFVAALEVIVYAGAIMVLFVFVVMMLNLGPAADRQEAAWMRPGAWAGPAVLGLVLLGELVYVVAAYGVRLPPGEAVPPRDVGVALYGPYLIAVELVSMLLLGGLVGAYHLGRRERAVFQGEQRDGRYSA